MIEPSASCRLPTMDRPAQPDLDALLRDLGDALVEAMTASDEIAGRLEELQAAGYSIVLRVDCSAADEDPEATSGEDGALAAAPGPDPTFRINGNDLSFLRSIGIDPTRKGPRRQR